MVSEKLIIGAGLSGLVTALALARRGHRMRMFDKRSEEQLLQSESGRSINLTVSERGLAALERTGLSADGVRRLGVAVTARCVHYPDGSQGLIPYGREGEAIYSISRSEMLRHWFELARRDARIESHFSVSRVSWSDEIDSLRVLAQRQDGRTLEFVPQQLFGADGVHSMVRGRLEATGLVRVNHERFSHGYKELVLSAARAEALGLSSNVIHAWPRADLVLMAFPNLDASFRAILFIPEHGPCSLDSIATHAGARRVLGQCLAPSANPLIDALAEELSARPAGWVSEVTCWPWAHAGRVALLGDAAHAMLPFYGQGINAIFEDCEVLDRALERYPREPARALREYAESRLPDTEAIAELSRLNFRELRERPLASDYSLHRQIERRLLALHPSRFAQIYGMVAFSSTPYRRVLEQHHWQETIIGSLVAMHWSEHELKSASFSAAVLHLLEQHGEVAAIQDLQPRIGPISSAVTAAPGGAEARAERRPQRAQLGEKDL